MGSTVGATPVWARWVAVRGVGRTVDVVSEDPMVVAALEEYAHLAARHTHQWHRFEVTAPSLHVASRLAARLGWWLHCWDLVIDPDADAISVVDRPAPAGGEWPVYPGDVR